MNWIADITYYSGAVVKNFDQWGVFGLSISTLDYGDMVRTENQELFGSDGETLGRTQPVIDGLGTFSGGDLAMGIKLRSAHHRPLANRRHREVLSGNLRRCHHG